MNTLMIDTRRVRVRCHRAHPSFPFFSSFVCVAECAAGIPGRADTVCVASLISSLTVTHAPIPLAPMIPLSVERFPYFITNPHMRRSFMRRRQCEAEAENEESESEDWGVEVKKEAVEGR